MNNINHYVHSFSHLRRGTTIYGPAPHKLVLLLAIIHDIETGTIKTNRIVPSDQLVAGFQSIWKEYVRSGHKLNFALPFYHLSKGFGIFMPFLARKVTSRSSPLLVLYLC